MTDILFLAALREETAQIRPIDGAAVVTTGDGPLRAARGAASAIERVRPRVVIGIGIAGAISPDLSRGDVVAGCTIVDEDGERRVCDPSLLSTAVALGAKPATLVTAKGVAATAEKKALALAIDGSSAVDLESAAWQRAAADRSLPFFAIRCILDRSDEDLPNVVLRSIRPDGSVSRTGVVVRALVHPAEIPALVDLRRRTADAAAVLARFVPLFAESIRARA